MVGGGHGGEKEWKRGKVKVSLDKIFPRAKKLLEMRLNEKYELLVIWA